MKRIIFIAVAGILLGFLGASTGLAAKADGKKAKLIAKYDKNGNGKIDAEEKDALRKDFAADPKGDLKAYDKDGDGKLSDDEIAAIKPGSGSAKSKEKGKTKTASSDKKKEEVKESAKADSKETKEK